MNTGTVDQAVHQKVGRRRRRLSWSVATALLGVGALAAAPALPVTLNGAPVAGSAIVQGGKAYISADALKAAGITVSVQGGRVNMQTQTAEGGANGVGAVEGCVNQQLFNGIWRLKVLGVTGDASAWHVKVQVAYGAKLSNVSMSGTGLPGDGGFRVQLDSGKVIAVRYAATELRDRGFVQGETFNDTLDFDADGTAGKPVKLLVPLDGSVAEQLGLHYSVKDPSFRVDLTCQK